VYKLDYFVGFIEDALVEAQEFYVYYDNFVSLSVMFAFMKK
jgi:hypothetical protein